MQLICKIIIVSILLIFLAWLIHKDKLFLNKYEYNYNNNNKYYKKNKPIINALIWKYPFPELNPHFNFGNHVPNINKVSISISGGGVRSYSASIGYFRALYRYGLINNIQYVSTVSGGSWFYGLYSYCSHVKEKTLLGNSLKPENMTLNKLEKYNKNNKYFMGHIFTKKDILEYLLEEFLNIKNDEIDLVWNNAIGKMILEPYNIDFKNPIAMNKEHANSILNRNQSIKKVLYSRYNSFWLCNTTLCDELFPHIVVPLTPLYGGFHQKLYNNGNMTGGTLVENHSFGSEIEKQKDTSIETRDNVKTLTDMIGTSSTAYATMLYKQSKDNNVLKYILPKDLTSLIPNYNIIGDTTNSSSKLADGGFSDNTGILSLAARNVKHIIAFANIHNTIESKCQINILPLFGIFSENCNKLDTLSPTGNFDVQIFNTGDYEKYIKPQFLKTKNDGGPVFARHTLEVIKNEKNGVKGGYEVDILFIVLAESINFLNKLPDEIKNEITDVPLKSFKKHHGKFNKFPNYDVAFHNFEKGMLYLSLSQINLLSSYTDWCLQQPELKKHVMEMFSY
jgi:hypothetical protein